MFVDSFEERAAAEAIARRAHELTGTTTYTMTALQPMGPSKLPCTIAAVRDGTVLVRVEQHVDRGGSVLIRAGSSIIIFGTASGTVVTDADGPLLVVEITSALIRRAAGA